MKFRDELYLRITKDVRTLDRYRLDLEEGVSAEVFGDPENASYEWRLVHANGLVEQHSDCGYGIPGVAMRDALVIFYGSPKFGGGLVDLRAGTHEPRNWDEFTDKAVSITVDMIEAADNELDTLRRDANRYRMLRDQWLRIGERSTTFRADGLDLWCDEHLADSDQ